MTLFWGIETNAGIFEGSKLEDIINDIALDCIEDDYTPDVKLIYCNDKEFDIDTDLVSKTQYNIDLMIENEKNS